MAGRMDRAVRFRDMLTSRTLDAVLSCILLKLQATGAAILFFLSEAFCVFRAEKHPAPGMLARNGVYNAELSQQLGLSPSAVNG